MFWRKKKRIAALIQIAHWKEEQRKTAIRISENDREQLADQLNENYRLKAKLYQTEKALMERIEEAEMLKVMLSESEKRGKEKLKKAYMGAAKLRAQVELLKNNLTALSVTVEEQGKECFIRYTAETELRAEIEVYRKLFGDLTAPEPQAESEELRVES